MFGEIKFYLSFSEKLIIEAINADLSMLIGEKFHEKIRKDDHKNRALILGSGWERDIAKEIDADLLIVSVPVFCRLVLNCGYAGYTGGLRAIEDIYDRVLDTYQ